MNGLPSVPKECDISVVPSSLRWIKRETEQPTPQCLTLHHRPPHPQGAAEAASKFRHHGVINEVEDNKQKGSWPSIIGCLINLRDMSLGFKSIPIKIARGIAV